jgi:hypothetical protein
MQLLFILALISLVRYTNALSPKSELSTLSGTAILSLFVLIVSPLFGVIYVRAPVQKRHTALLYLYSAGSVITAIAIPGIALANMDHASTLLLVLTYVMTLSVPSPFPLSTNHQYLVFVCVW